MHSVKDSVFLWICIGVLVLVWAGNVGALVLIDVGNFWATIFMIVLISVLMAASIATFLYACAPSGRRAIDVLRPERSTCTDANGVEPSRAAV